LASPNATASKSVRNESFSKAEDVPEAALTNFHAKDSNNFSSWTGDSYDVL